MNTTTMTWQDVVQKCNRHKWTITIEDNESVTLTSMFPVGEKVSRMEFAPLEGVKITIEGRKAIIKCDTAKSLDTLIRNKVPKIRNQEVFNCKGYSNETRQQLRSSLAAINFFTV